MNKIVTALVGYGLSGREFHLPQLMSNKHYQLKTVMTTDPKKQADLKSILPNLNIVTNYEAILNDTDIDLVILAVSNDVHFDYTKKALLKNKHVICEKPFVKTLEEATYLFELSKKQGCLLRVFHNRKYDGDILTVEKLMKEKPYTGYFTTGQDASDVTLASLMGDTVKGKGVQTHTVFKDTSKLVKDSVKIAKNVIDGVAGLTGLTGGPKIDGVNTAYTLIDELVITDKQKTYDLIFKSGYKSETSPAFSNINFAPYKS